MGIQESFTAYKNAIGSAFATITSNLGDKPKKLVTAYKNYVDTKPDDGNAPLSIKDWAKSDASKAERDAIEDAIEALTQSDIDAAIAAVENQQTITDAYKKLEEDGKGIGGWLGDNWPMLAAIAAPLLLGNFFEIGTIGTLLVGVIGLGVAAYMSSPDSMLGQGYEFVKKQTGGFFGLVKEPEKTVDTKAKEAGATANAQTTTPAVDPNAPVPVKPTPPSVSTGNPDLATVTQIADMGTMKVKVGTPPADVDQRFAIVGTTVEGITNYDSFVLLDKDSNPVGKPIALKDGMKPVVATDAAGKTTVTLDASKRGALAVDPDTIKATTEQKAAEVKKAAESKPVEDKKAAEANKSPEANKPAEANKAAETNKSAQANKATPLQSELLAFATIDYKNDKGEIESRQVARLVEFPAGQSSKTGTGTIQQYVMLDATGKKPASPSINVEVEPKLTVQFKDGKPDPDLIPDVAALGKLQALATPPLPSISTKQAQTTPATESKGTSKSMNVLGVDNENSLLVEYAKIKVDGKDVTVAARGAITSSSDPENPDFTTNATMTELVVLDASGKPTDVRAPLRNNQDVTAYGNPPQGQVDMVFTPEDLQALSAGISIQQQKGKAPDPSTLKPELAGNTQPLKAKVAQKGQGLE